MAMKINFMVVRILQLDDWVLRCIYKKGTIEKLQPSNDVVVSCKI